MKASVKGQKVIHPLKPIFNKDSEVLILGSFPSVVSRNRNMYYANPTNRFWKVMEMMFSMQIENREQFCLQQHLALWDVIHS
ncbi:MAG: DNA-deoxyinosine glycosylase, partial [Bulleidia sp.]|nr:DNA-deoxyinosine glycosylase [Bulleidia sp.]